MKRYALFLTFIFFLFVAPLPAQQKAISIDEVITLKKLGYSDEDILKELKSSKAVFQLKKGDIEKLQKAGLGEGLIKWMKGTPPKVAVTLEMIIRWTGEGVAPQEILRRIAKGKSPPKFTARQALGLIKAKVHPAILYALKGKALTEGDLLELAGKATSEETYLQLLQMVGCEFKPDAKKALQLLRSGIPSDIVKALIKGVPKSAPSTTSTPEESSWSQYDHVGQEFQVSHPASWKVLKELKDGLINYVFTADQVSSPKEVKKGFSLTRFYLTPDSPFYGLNFKEIFERLTALLQAAEPALKKTSSVEPCQIGSFQGLRVHFSGTLKDLQGEFAGFFAATIRQKVVYFFGAHGPKEDSSTLGPIFEEMLKKIRLGRPVIKTRGTTWQADVLVDKVKPSVVCVMAGNEKGWVASGSGFIIREDGYIVTNHHVVYDESNKKFFSRFRIAWDSTLQRKPVMAVLIGARRERGNLLQSLTLGGADIALLKIKKGGSYQPVQLTSLSEVKLGDPVVAMGFPRVDLFDNTGGLNLSIFVTKGGVVRFNRSEKGIVKSIYTDAKITHGNSGGPCFNLNTGGVFGINTFGAWHGIETDIPQLKKLQLGDLVGYFGVIPLHYVFHSFPQYSQFPAGFDKNFTLQDRLILAQDFLNQKLISAALREIDGILKTDPDQVDALLLQGYGLFLQQEFKEGLQAFQKALQKDPKHYNALVRLGTVYYHIKDYLKAADLIERAVELRKDDYSLRLLRSKIYLAIKRYEEALAEAKEANNLVKGILPDSHVLTGEIYYSMGKLEEGKQSYQEALKSNPWYIPAWLGLGEYFEKKQMYEAAILEYAKLRRKRPRAPESWEAIGRCYRELKKYKKAYEFYSKAINICLEAERAPGEEMLYHCGWIAQNVLKEAETALVIYRTYFNYYTTQPQSWRGHLEVARLFREKNLPGLAWAHFSRAKAHAPEEQQIKDEQDRMVQTALSVEDLIRMARGGYSPLVMMDLIRVTPLGFRITTKEEVKKLAEAKIPIPVIVFILQIQKARGQGGNGGNQQNTGGILAQMAGQWKGQTNMQGHQVAVLLAIAQNGQFAMRFFNQQGYPFQQWTGTITIQSSKILAMNTQTPAVRQMKFFYQLNGNTLKLGSDTFYRQ